MKGSTISHCIAYYCNGINLPTSSGRHLQQSPKPKAAALTTLFFAEAKKAKMGNQMICHDWSQSSDCALTMQQRKSCSSDNCHQWQSQSHRPHICNHSLVDVMQNPHNFPLDFQSSPKLSAVLSHQFWRWCTGKFSSFGAPRTSVCTPHWLPSLMPRWPARELPKKIHNNCKLKLISRTKLKIKDKQQTLIATPTRPFEREDTNSQVLYIYIYIYIYQYNY